MVDQQDDDRRDRTGLALCQSRACSAIACLEPAWLSALARLDVFDLP